MIRIWQNETFRITTIRIHKMSNRGNPVITKIVFRPLTFTSRPMNSPAKRTASDDARLLIFRFVWKKELKYEGFVNRG